MQTGKTKRSPSERNMVAPTMDTEVFEHTDHHPTKSLGLGSRSYISIGLFGMMLAGILGVINILYGIKGDVINAKNEFSSRMDKFEWNQSQMQREFTDMKAKKSEAETWNDLDMLKWSIQFQKDNPSIKVPEPVMHRTPNP